jgi:DNA-binding LacI/PurR family transcriptional regulator
LREAGIVPNPEWVALDSSANSSQSDVDSGQKLLPSLLAKGVSAVFCYNDMAAIGTLLACREAGLSVPDDLSVVGFDDIPLAHYVTPPLTTMRQPMQEIGRYAMQMLLDLLDEKKVENRTLNPLLVERGSSAVPRSKPD